MKKLVLCICLLPVISFAQQTSGHFLKVFNRTTQTVSSLRMANTALDSTYTYQGSDNKLTDIAYYTYDESGRKIKMETKSAYSSDGDLSLSSKTEYIILKTLEILLMKRKKELIPIKTGSGCRFIKLSILIMLLLPKRQ